MSNDRGLGAVALTAKKSDLPEICWPSARISHGRQSGILVTVSPDFRGRLPGVSWPPTVCVAPTPSCSLPSRSGRKHSRGPVFAPQLVSSIDWVNKNLSPVGHLFEELAGLREREVRISTLKPKVGQPNGNEGALEDLP